MKAASLPVYILLLCHAGLFIDTTAQTRIDMTLEVDSVQRQFIIARPSGTAPAGGYPLVVMLHGTSGDGEKFYNISGWKEKGEQENFVTVFPSALQYCFYTDDGSGMMHLTTKWKNGDALQKLCPGARPMKDDITFLRRMIDTIAALLPINLRKMYVSGFSNGGAMASKLMVEMSDIFAAASCGSGLLSEQDSAQARRNLPAWFILGTDDPLWLLSYQNAGIPLQRFPFNDSTVTHYLAPHIQRYLGALGLANQYRKDSIGNVLTYTYTTPSSALPVTEFRFSLIRGLEHEYPNGVNHWLVAANFLWDFYKRQQLPTTVESAPATMAFDVYPNPAQEYFIVKCTGEVHVSLSNLLGQSVFASRTTGGQRITLPTMARGVYTLRLEHQGIVQVSSLAIIPR
ncbi:MAG: T9SS type A sorting domain-containing protein [Ignavibacteriae bacterium]|nr:T9SS type A sorting domain-containing protein [Ignavibacteriota bacterium]